MQASNRKKKQFKIKFEKPQEPGYEMETIAVLGQCRLKFGHHVTNVNGSCSANEPFGSN